MKLLTSTLAAFLLIAATASAEVRVTMHDGLVTVIAKDATVRQIIAEWARVGQAKVVNAERIPGGPVTLELVNVPEVQALDTLLRTVAGYLAAPRAELASNLSRFDRIVVMPTSATPRSQPVAQAPTFQQQQFPPPVEEDVDEQRPNANMPVAAPRPVFGRFPAPQVINPQTGLPVAGPNDPPTGVPAEQQQPVYTSVPTAPFGGVAVPGMVAPAPQQQPGIPGQIVPPPQPQPGQTRRPGGL
ncbi:MAG TPA: hypothetical protein VH497_21035 [Vicinamibacterales bacterium]|jgi:hypothetical protein